MVSKNKSTHSIPQTVTFPVGTYLFKVSNRNTRARCEKCSKLAIKTPGP